jgi:hypothetical protein
MDKKKEFREMLDQILIEIITVMTDAGLVPCRMTF